MQNQNIVKPTKLAAFFVSISLVLDGFSTLAFGLLYFFITASSDPIDFNMEAKNAAVRQGEIGAFLTFVYLVLCVISIVFWQQGKRNWNYIILGLGLIHIIGSSYLFTFRDEIDFFAYLFYGSIPINIILLAIIILGKNKSKSIIQSSQA
jgi:hypothetical protein